VRKRSLHQCARRPYTSIYAYPLRLTCPIFGFILSLLSLNLFGQSVVIPKTAWTLKSVTTFQKGNPGTLAIDGNPSTYWHSVWASADSVNAKLPQDIQVDLGGAYDINGFGYTPRVDGGNGTIIKYDFLVSTNGVNWKTVISDGTFNYRTSENIVNFAVFPKIRYVKLIAKTAVGNNYASCAELNVFKKSTSSPVANFRVTTTLVKTGGKLAFSDASTLSPTSWEWTFPGGTPSSSTLQNPSITYSAPGTYNVTLKVVNANGSSTVTKKALVTVSNKVNNFAMCLDGNDNCNNIGMDTLKLRWTIEMWIKGNDNVWKETETLIGCGTYGDINAIDQEPLLIKNGKLYSTKANISSPNVLDSKWHHVALTCDGSVTRMYLDGAVVGSAKVASSILPGSIGCSHSDSKTANQNTFGGLIDEVRIWNVALPASTINKWKNKILDPTHPNFNKLKGYYPFDDMVDEVAINWVGKGHLPFHMSNRRGNYEGTAPMAYIVASDNPNLLVPSKNQELFNAVTIQSEWDADKGMQNDQILKLRIAVNGDQNPLKLTELKLDLSKCSNLSDITKVHVYYTGKVARSSVRKELFGNGTMPSASMILKDTTGFALSQGINYFLVTFDISSNATFGDTLRAYVPSFKLNNISYTPSDGTGNVRKMVTQNSINDPNILKVLQQNIWHGGQHLGTEGRQRIIDMIRATNADIITMQEGYGAQHMIADSLKLNLKTPSSTDNLALFSRYPMIPIASSAPFYSNPAYVILPNGRKILVADWWLRYATNPDYTDYHANPGLDTNMWITEDLNKSTADAKRNLKSDVNPYITDKDMPVIIGADFNSSSHLEWTAAAAPLHYGYGPVALPTSKCMVDSGYTDSFRSVWPDEVKYPQGTWAPIYGHLGRCRIDYIYHKGKGINAIASKIVRTPYEIDYVWPSDHGGLLTVFEVNSSKE
jgi:FOG: PKD repeat